MAKTTGPRLQYPLDTKDQRAWVVFRQKSRNVEIKEGGLTVKEAGSDVWGECYLYLPGGLSVNDTVTYDSAELGTLGAFAKDQIDAGRVDKRIGRVLKDTAGKFGDSLQNALEEVYSGNISTGVAVKLLSSSVARRLGTKTTAGITAGIRATGNPHKHSVFNGVNIREFSFSFNFVPESKEEADEVRRIIQFFREAVYPTYDNFDYYGNDGRGDTNEEEVFANQLVYKFPNMWDVEIKYLKKAADDVNELAETLEDKIGEHQFGHKFLTCHLQSVKTDFDPDSTFAYRSDGQFPSFNLELSFVEETTLTRDKIEQGY